MSHRVEGLEHVGIAVEDIAQAKVIWQGLGFNPQQVEELPEQGVRSHIMAAPGGVCIELLESLRDDSTVKSFMDRHGPGLHHLCLQVSSLEGTLASPGVRELRLVETQPRSDERGRRVFVHPSSTGGVLIGLVEPHRTPDA